MKKEARIARIEVLPGGSALIIVFRGGWVDGLSALAGGVGQGRVAGWLEGSKYLEELKGISLGEGFGTGEAAGLRAWARSRGLPEVEIGARNRKQAQVLVEGFDRLLEGKG
jgi:hypothetical protein